ncbi:MAG: hypothetical protein A3B38_03170 [Candidatus Levybacteria bacterium RIFCSPLOWO2_01_FULL_36_13]|nr:MAG: hypothetical protein A2684_01545 [Candidatus Levybacteria bacterium RIFCSPHIGHO2_01_FULL_36_15b]OGH34518.1 MAG: hypothetical protein A3B38_03170 [Candidatus Levybacteria bacterium RIFCSPLOWO2_01_FULL_36_13]
MKRITMLSLGLGAIGLGLIAAHPNIADAYRGDPSVQGPNYSEERHEAMEKAFENKDYNVWKNLMQNRGRITQVINKDNFAKLAEAHRLAEQGKIQEANQIRQSLGLGLQNGNGQMSGMGMYRWSK